MPIFEPSIQHPRYQKTRKKKTFVKWTIFEPTIQHPSCQKMGPDQKSRGIIRFDAKIPGFSHFCEHPDYHWVKLLTHRSHAILKFQKLPIFQEATTIRGLTFSKHRNSLSQRGWDPVLPQITFL